MNELTVYQLSLEDLDQVAEGLVQRLRFLDLAPRLTSEDIRDMLTEAVQEVKDLRPRRLRLEVHL